MTTLKREDFVNSNEVRWCPGCGDYAILSALQKLMPELGLPPQRQVFVSGIGCSGRLPYYMNTFGFHTIHGRAPAVATGLKTMRDDVMVWLITGDGDGFSIGGNHLIHCLRRNININILLVNNQVYGLTKGQFSPTSPIGQVTKTSPNGVEASPLNPIKMALAAGATFVARALDKDPAHLGEVLKAAAQHEGVSFVEIYQDCHIFNAGAFDDFALKANRGTNTNVLKAGEHDAQDFMKAMELANHTFPENPVPIGVFYQVSKPVMRFGAKVEKTVDDLALLYRRLGLGPT